MPTTLRDFVLEAQRLRAEGSGQEEIIAWVYSVAERYGIRVRHDLHEPHAIPEVVNAGADAGQPTGPVATSCGTGVAAAPGKTPSPACEAPLEREPKAAAETAGADEAADATKPIGADDATGTTNATAEEAIEATSATETIKAIKESDPKNGPPHSGKKKGHARERTIAVPVTRRADGTHCLSLASIFDPGLAEGQAPPPRGATVGRIVLSGDKRGGASRSKGIPLHYECNGFVLDARTWRALAVPPSAFNSRPTVKAVNALLAENLYDVIRVDDGTVVTLYSWQHPTDGVVWALASSNGYDVSSLYWIGPLTYAEVFYDIAQRLYPAFGKETGMTLSKKEDGTTRLCFTWLNPGLCYAVGFRHHNFHPMLADPERMWQIQCTDLSGGIPKIVHDKGLPAIPEQTLYADLGLLAEAATAALGGPDEPGRQGTLTVEGLQALGRDAFTRACDFAAKCAKNAPAFGGKLPDELNYGYILRSRDPRRTGEFSDVLIETPLLARVRKIVYERAPRSVRDELTADDRLEYNAMRAYLTANERPDFLALYPDRAPLFQAFEEFVNNVVHLVIHAIRQRAMAPTNREPAMRSATGQVARALLDHICCYENLSAFHQNTESIVRDYVVNPEYAFLFLRAMRSAVSTARPAAPDAQLSAVDPGK